MTVNELARKLYDFTFDDTMVLESVNSLSGKLGIQGRRLRTELIIFKIFVVFWWVYRSNYIRGRYGSGVVDELQSAYVSSLKERLKPNDEEEFLDQMDDRLKKYNLAHDAWYAAMESKAAGTNMEVEEAFSRFWSCTRT
jgi:hypothetical protein